MVSIALKRHNDHYKSHKGKQFIVAGLQFQKLPGACLVMWSHWTEVNCLINIITFT